MGAEEPWGAAEGELLRGALKAERLARAGFRAPGRLPGSGRAGVWAWPSAADDNPEVLREGPAECAGSRNTGGVGLAGSVFTTGGRAAGAGEACCCCCWGFAGLGQWERAAEGPPLAGLTEGGSGARGDCAGGAGWVALPTGPG